MGQSSGFMQYNRESVGYRPVEERLLDRRAIQVPMVESRLVQQAARCMDCGIPFCHTGVTANGQSSGCPMHNLIPEWNDLVYRGLWKEAYDRLAKTNNFPEFTGLVCPAPCEASCNLGLNDSAVTIKNIEYAIVEKAFHAGWIEPHMPQRLTGRRVAIIGSGPAGLACADQLNQVGHQVTVFERADRIGGLLTYGIPNMKLDKAIVERRVTLMAAAGVEFVTNVEVGVNYDAGQLRREYDAIVLCLGSTRPWDLRVEGRDLLGVHFAVDFLQADTRRLLGHQGYLPESISATRKDVIVIGGGDTGTDCVATALRQRPRSLVQLEIMPRPPQERAPDNPWPQWPRIFKMDYGQEEAAALFGQDPRQYEVMTKAIIGDDYGQVRAIQTTDVRWEPNPNGGDRPVLHEVPGSGQSRPAQLVLLAMGFMGPDKTLLEQLGVERDGRARVKAEYGAFTAGEPGIFAAGDVRRGQSLVVSAIDEGRGAAREVDRYLMGETDLP
jgi:glutamate synthase (NADPH/NADH) small chain